MASSIPATSLTNTEPATAAINLRPFGDLPQELWNRILSYLNSNDLRTVASTSKQMCARVVVNVLTDKNRNWKEQWPLVRQIVQDCMRANQMELAIQSAHQISNDYRYEKGDIFHCIIKKLVDRTRLAPPGVRRDVDLLLSLEGTVRCLAVPIGFFEKDALALQPAVTALIQFGESEKAIPFAQCFWGIQPTCMAMLDIVKGLVNENKLDKAREIANPKQIENRTHLKDALSIIESATATTSTPSRELETSKFLTWPPHRQK